MISLLLRSAQQTVFKYRQINLIHKLGFKNKPFYGSGSGRFTVKDFFYENANTEAGSLLTRFVKYLAIESCKVDPLTPQKIRYSDYYPVTDLKSFNSALNETPTDQLPRLLVFTYTYKTNGDPVKFVQALNEIDQVCVERMPEMDYDCILRTLYSFIFLMPGKLTKTEFYQRGMSTLVSKFDNSNLQKEYFTQTCFYLGLWKKNKQSTSLMKDFLQSNLPTYLGNLNRNDLAIVSNSAFKTSVIIGNEEFNQRLVEEILRTEPTDDALLVTLVKSARLNRIKSEKICEKLKRVLTETDASAFHFKGLVHIFAYFSECLRNDEEVCKLLIDECIQRLNDTGRKDQVFNDMRAKDLATFLWSCANLSARDLLSADDFQLLEETILSKIHRDEYKYCPDELIDSCLCLCMLGNPSEQIVTEVFKLNVNPNAEASQRVKLDSRLRLLANCIAIEQPEWSRKKFGKEKPFNEAKPAPEYLIKNNPALKTVLQLLNDQADELALKTASIVAPIADLNIASVLAKFENGRKCYVEVLSRSHVLRFDEKPIGLVGLKIRLLEHLGYEILEIKPEESDNQQLLQSIFSKKFSDSTTKEAESAKKIAV